ncbi:MAG: hypothetical protein Q7J12_03725 [Syntrophales bacterium]|nr:hypothetical protein [Syntrophales bacterium]
MRAISKKIVHDEHMRPVAVQINYKDWLEIEKILEGQKKRKTMSINKHAGVIRLSEDPVSFQRRMREDRFCASHARTL